MLHGFLVTLWILSGRIVLIILVDLVGGTIGVVSIDSLGYRSPSSFILRANMPFYRVFLNWLINVGYIFILIFNRLICILSSTQSGESIHIRSPHASSIWLALGSSGTIWLATLLDQLSLRFHQVILIFTSFRSALSTSLHNISFMSCLWIRVANSFAWPLPTVGWRFVTSAQLFTDRLDLGLLIL